jgi:CBS domain containing-hemolysin-like protein
LTFTQVLIVCALPVLLLAAALCSSAETSLFSLTYHDRVRLKRLSPRAAHAAASLLAAPRELLVGLLFVNMIATALYLVLTSLLVLGNESVLVTVGVSVLNLVLMTVMAEVVSKMLAARYCVEFARLLAPLCLVVLRAMGPLRRVLDRGLIAPLTRLFIPPVKEGTGMSAGDLSALLSAGASEGAIEPDEQRALRQVIHFGGVRVREVMTPRVEMEWLEEGATFDEVARLVRSRGFTRVPVLRSPGVGAGQRPTGGGGVGGAGGAVGVRGTAGATGTGGAGGVDEEVAGVLDVKRYLVRAARGSNPRVTDCLDPAKFVPERATLDQLLEQFRSGTGKVALAVDEYGGLAGIVTLADCVKRLVVEFSGEQDAGADGGVELHGLGEWSVPGRFPARDWSEMFGIAADPRATTVSGLVFSRLGRVPVVGDVVSMGNVRIRVAKVQGRIAERVIVSLAPEGTPAGGAP